MIRPGTFERVYAAIKRQLGEGRYQPGERIEPAVLADQLNASVTPVRDALHRLTGERLVETPRQDGFRAPLLTENMLRHLYAWHLDVLLLAMARPNEIRRGAANPQLSDLPDDRLRQAFIDLALTSANPEHGAALRNAAERLAPFQRLEQQFLDATEAETDQIVGAIQTRDWSDLRRGLVRYHRRRQRIIPALLERLNSPN